MRSYYVPLVFFACVFTILAYLIEEYGSIPVSLPVSLKDTTRSYEEENDDYRNRIDTKYSINKEVVDRLKNIGLSEDEAYEAALCMRQNEKLTINMDECIDKNHCLVKICYILVKKNRSSNPKCQFIMPNLLVFPEDRKDCYGEALKRMDFVRSKCYLNTGAKLISCGSSLRYYLINSINK